MNRFTVTDLGISAKPDERGLLEVVLQDRDDSGKVRQEARLFFHPQCLRGFAQMATDNFQAQPDPVCTCGKTSEGRCPRCGEKIG